MCALEIRRLARFMKIKCLLSAKLEAEAGEVGQEELSKADSSEVNKGEWSGWGYLYSFNNTLFQNDKPFYITVKDRINF